MIPQAQILSAIYGLAGCIGIDANNETQLDICRQNLGESLRPNAALVAMNPNQVINACGGNNVTIVNGDAFPV